MLSCQAFHTGSHRVKDSPTRVTGQLVGPRYARCDTRLVAVVVFRLSTLEEAGSMPRYLQNHLQSWFSGNGNMIYRDIPFNIRNAREDALVQLEERIWAVIDELTQCVHTLYFFTLFCN